MKLKSIKYIVIAIALIGCSEPQYTFLDIESGTIELDKGEMNAIQNLISAYNIPKEDILITVDQTSYNYTFSITNNYITKLNFDSQPFHDMRFVSDFKHLEHITISKSGISKVEGIENLGKLKHLELIDNNIESLSLATENNTIEYINLYNNKLQNLEGIKSFKKLISLSAGGNQITDASAINNNNHIKYLTLDNNLLDSLRVENCESLHDISCNNNGLEYFQLNNLSGLSNANFENNNISNFEINNTQLHELNLTGNNIEHLPENFNEETVVNLVYENVAKQPTKDKKGTGNEFWDEMYEMMDSLELANGVIYTDDQLYNSGSSLGRYSVAAGSWGEKGVLESVTGNTWLKFTNPVKASSHVAVNFTVETGKIRVYLEGDQERGALKYQTAEKNKPGFIFGNAFKDSEKLGLYTYFIRIESEEGTAKGIKYDIKY